MFADIPFAGGKFVEIDPVRKRFAVPIITIVMEFVERDGRIKRVNGEDTATCNRVDFQTYLVGGFREVVSEMGAASRHKWVREVGNIFDFKFPSDSRSAIRV